MLRIQTDGCISLSTAVLLLLVHVTLPQAIQNEMGNRLSTFSYLNIGGGGKIGECIATELAKENVTIVLWDVNDSKFQEEGITCILTT